jgi:uncharacterized protein (TIGR03086 family)
MEIIDFRGLHARSLGPVTALVERVTRADAGRATPCPPWDLYALLGHMIGQNHGFADAVGGPADAPLTAFVPVPPGDRPAEAWAASAGRLTAAFAGADPARPVRLPEISPADRFPTWMAIGFQLLDTVVHGWDVATALGLPYRPDRELAGATLRLAGSVPDGPAREGPRAAFAPALPAAGDDPWPRALALLGRRDPG